jgi:hypothetical protein
MRIDATGQRLSQLLLKAAELRRKQVQHQTVLARTQVAQLEAKRAAEATQQAGARQGLSGGGQSVPGHMMALLEDARAADSAAMQRLDHALATGSGQLELRQAELRQAGRRHLRAAHVAAYVETRRRSEAHTTEQRRLEDDASAHRIRRETT